VSPSRRQEGFGEIVHREPYQTIDVVMAIEDVVGTLNGNQPNRDPCLGQGLRKHLAMEVPDDHVGCAVHEQERRSRRVT
jgi:hypothetical protein